MRSSYFSTCCEYPRTAARAALIANNFMLKTMLILVAYPDAADMREVGTTGARAWSRPHALQLRLSLIKLLPCRVRLTYSASGPT